MRRGRARRRRAISRQVSSLAAQFVQSIHTRGVGRSLCSAGRSRAGGAVQACWCFSLCPSGLQGHCCQGPALCAEDTHPGSPVVTNFQNLCAQRLGLESSCWSGCWNIHRGAAVTHGMDSAPLFSLGTFCGASSRAHAQHEGNQDRSLNCRLEAGSCEAGQQPRLPPSPSAPPCHLLCQSFAITCLVQVTPLLQHIHGHSFIPSEAARAPSMCQAGLRQPPHPLVLVSYWPDLRLPQPPGLAFSSGHMLAPLPAGPLASPRHGWPSPQPRVMNPTQMLTASLTGPPPLVAPPWPLQSQPLPPQPGGTSELYLGSTSLSHSGSPRPLPPSTASQSQVPSGSPISEQD